MSALSLLLHTPIAKRKIGLMLLLKRITLQIYNNLKMPLYVILYRGIFSFKNNELLNQLKFILG
jgi:hypothetical protein